jgi:hypothetical protein
MPPEPAGLQASKLPYYVLSGAFPEIRARPTQLMRGLALHAGGWLARFALPVSPGLLLNKPFKKE